MNVLIRKWKSMIKLINLNRIDKLRYKTSRKAELKRIDLYKSLFSMGEGIKIRSGVIIKEYKNISIGDRVSIQENCYLNGYGGINIGDDVSIGNSTRIVSTEHDYSKKGVIRNNPLIIKPVNIGNNVWIGMDSNILGGTIIEDNVIVAAGSLVKGTLKSNGIYAGVPAKKIKEF